jgi:hypothetical protein
MEFVLCDNLGTCVLSGLLLLFISCFLGVHQAATNPLLIIHISPRNEGLVLWFITQLPRDLANYGTALHSTP